MKKTLYFQFILSSIIFLSSCSSNFGIDVPEGMKLSIRYDESSKNIIVFDMKWVDGSFISREDVFEFLVNSTTKLKDENFVKVEFAFDGERRIYAMRDAFLNIKNRISFYKNLKRMNDEPFFKIKFLDDSKLTMNKFIGEWFWADKMF